MQSIRVVDSHTGGEPTRLVISGGPELGMGSMAVQLRELRTNHDRFRRAVVNEPRGSDVLVGALLCQPVDPAATAGVIFFNNVGYLGMCGHGTIGLVASLAFLGRIGPGKHLVETPVGTVGATLLEDGSVSVNNVPAYRLHHAVEVKVDWSGAQVPVRGDVAWGGNWFFLCADPAEAFGLEISMSRLPDLLRFTTAVKSALAAAGITGSERAEIDHIELFTLGRDGANSRSYVLCPGDAYDRSPCGTGTSAKLACLAADGLLAPGVAWVQESVVGSRFEARYTLGSDGAVRPVITGRAWVTAESTLLVDPDDEFGWGIP